MLRYTRQIAAALALMFAGLIAACPVVACTSGARTEAPKHACCPKSKKTATKAHTDCPLIAAESRAAVVKTALPVAELPVATFSLPRSTDVWSAAVEHYAPDRGELHILHRVLRI